MYDEIPATEESNELERAPCWMLVNKELEKLRAEIVDENGLLFLVGGDISCGRDQQIEMFTDFREDKGFYLSNEPA